jgi:hypothetical protein
MNVDGNVRGEDEEVWFSGFKDEEGLRRGFICFSGPLLRNRFCMSSDFRRGVYFVKCKWPGLCYPADWERSTVSVHCPDKTYLFHA